MNNEKSLKSIKIPIEICNTIMELLFLYIINLSIPYLLQPLEVYYKNALLVFPIFLVVHFINKYSPNIVVFLLLNTIVGISIFIFNIPTLETIVLFISFFIFVLVEISSWKKELTNVMTYIPVWTVIINVGLIFYGTINNVPTLTSICFCFGNISLIAYLIRMYFLNLTSYLEINQNSTSMNINKLINTNTLITMLLIFSSSGIVGVFIYFRLDKYLFDLTSFVERLFNTFNNVDATMMLNPNRSEPTTESASSDMSYLYEYAGKEPNDFTRKLIEILDKFLVVFAVLVVLIFIFALIAIFYSFVKMYMKRNISDTDIIEKVVDEHIESTKKNQRNKGNVEKHNDYRKQVRKIYKKKLFHYYKSDVPLSTSDTPIEISKKIKEHNEESIDNLTNVYEKARYSNHTISKDEVNKIH